MPLQVKEVLEEIKEKPKGVIQDTLYQKQERLDKELDALQQGRESHAAFRANWESLLNEMEDARMEIAKAPEILKRK